MKEAILERYESEQKVMEDKDVIQRGLNLYGKKAKVGICVLAALMFAPIIVMYVLIFCQVKIAWYLVLFIITIVIAILLSYTDKKLEKKTASKKAEMDLKRIGKLNGILTNDFSTGDNCTINFGINTKEKVLRLIDLYQPYIDKIAKREETRNICWTTMVGVIGTFFAGFSSVTDSSGFGVWKFILLLMYFLIIVLMSWIILYTLRFSNIKKKKYEEIVQDLKMLVILKYSDKEDYDERTVSAAACCQNS